VELRHVAQVRCTTIDPSCSRRIPCGEHRDDSRRPSGSQPSPDGRSSPSIVLDPDVAVEVDLHDLVA